MFTRVVLNTIGRIFPRPKEEPKNWEEAYRGAQEDIKALEKRVEDLQRAIQQWTEALQKPGTLSITQASIDASIIGSQERATGAFSKLGVGQAAPTSSDYSAVMGSGSGRQYVIADGGASGNSSGPAFVLAYGGIPLQGIGGYSSIGLSVGFDQRLTLYSQAFDLVIAHSSNSYALDFVNPADGSGASTGTLTNAPSAGNPSYWLKIKIAGNVRYIPCWS